MAIMRTEQAPGNKIDSGLNVLNSAGILNALAVTAVGAVFSEPIYVGTWEWIFFRVTFTASAGTPTVVTFTPQSSTLIDPGIAADWCELPYEPAIAGAGNPPFFDYTPTRAWPGVNDVKQLRIPCFDNWMRLGLQLDAGTATAQVTAVRRLTAVRG